MEICQVNSNSYQKNFKELENSEQILDLIIENHDLKSNWSEIKRFKNLKCLSLMNNLINGEEFYKNLSELKNLQEIIIDEDCYFLNYDISKKSNLKFNSLKKFCFIFRKKDQLNFDFLNSEDNHRSGKMNFLSFPNFPNSIMSLEEIEFKNYENYLNSSETNYNDEHSFIYNLNINNFSRLKNLRNIVLADSKEQLIKNDKIIDRIFNFSNDKKIKINNTFIKDLKTEFSKSKILYLDFNPNNPGFDLNTGQYDLSLSREGKENNLKIHYPSHEYYGFSERIKNCFTSSDLIDINLDEALKYCYETDGFIDDLLLQIESQNIKKIRINIGPVNLDYFNSIYLIDHFIKSKNKNIYYDFHFLKKNNEFGDNIMLLNFIHSNEKKKLGYKISSNLNKDILTEYLNNIYLEKVKTIMIFDDQSKSPTFKKLNNIEIPLSEWPYTGEGFKTLELDLSSENLEKNKKDKWFSDFFHDRMHWGDMDLLIDEKEENPNGQIIFVKKDFLKNATKKIFNKVENISFQSIIEDVESKKYFSYDDIKNNQFNFPASVGKTSIKKLVIYENSTFKFSDLKEFKNLEEFRFSGHLDEDDKEMNIFPEMKKLKTLEINLNFPFKTEKDSTFKNFEKSSNLEKVILSIGYCVKRDGSRWTSSSVDFSKFSLLEKLNYLELNSIQQDKIKNLNNLKALKTLKIINPFMITEDMGSDDGTVHKPLNHQDFEFLKSSSVLEKLVIYFPRSGQERIDINFPKFIKNVNKDLKEINFIFALDSDQEEDAHDLINEITSHFNDLEKIRLWIQDIDYPEIKYDKRLKNGYEKATRAIEEKAKNPVIIDIKLFSKFKNLKDLDLKINHFIGSKIMNLDYLSYFDEIDLKAKNYHLKKDELEKLFYSIATKRELYMYEHNKKRLKLKNKNFKFEIIGEDKLDQQNKEEYNLIKEEESKKDKIRINNTDIDELLLKDFLR